MYNDINVGTYYLGTSNVITNSIKSLKIVYYIFKLYKNDIC